MLDDLGLSPAISWQTREFSRGTGVDVQLKVDPGADSLPDAYRTCIYRVVQEALTNCARHAGAKQIQLTFGSVGDALRLTIHDDGVGFDRSSRTLRGMGLLGMEERVRELGGRFAVKSSPGIGTEIEVELPPPKAVEVKT
jgi:signal transduction histidine kinase